MTNIEERAKSYEEQLLEWYTHLHTYPETSFSEVHTTEYLIEQLEAIGGYTLTRVSNTGVVADITCGKPGPKVALRADIDALAMPEHSGLSFASVNDGVMHACGHDGHMTMLLGAAKLIRQRQDELSGSYRLLFQPGEELFPGGAKEYVEKGVLDGVDYILGQHVAPFLPTGTFGLVEGPIMGATDVAHIKIIGQGGHASMPHLNTDVIATGAEIVTNLQHLVAREVDPLAQAVISITNFHAGTAHNVMAGEALLSGSIRTFDEEVRQYLAKRIEKVATAIARAHRCEAEVVYEFGYPATVNDAAVTRTVRAALRDLYGEAALPEQKPLMAGEDFASYLKVCRGTFYFIGVGNEEKECKYPLHHSCFKLDPDALPLGVAGLIAGSQAVMRAHPIAE